MNKQFEAMIRRMYGSLYSLERDMEDNYVCGIVRRMFEVWRAAKGSDNENCSCSSASDDGDVNHNRSMVKNCRQSEMRLPIIS